MAEERRLVTVLFADVTGSTELGESLDPEDVRALLGRFYAIAKDVVASHGGTVEKFIGDAVMAVFGLPTAHGDDAVRAVSAALEIRDRVRNEPRLGDRLPVRMGVNSGEVVATRDSSAGDFLVTGDAVNVAARLQQSAEPWQVLCGERVVRAASHAFSFAPLSAVAAKGKRGGVTAAPVLGRAEARRARIPLVGRDADLAQLELLARRSFSERRPSLISVIAPAGTGKTRLLEEFLDRLPSLSPNAAVAIAQCLPYGQRLTYWPLRAVLFRLAAIDEGAAPPQVRDAIRAWLRSSEMENAERVAELLAATVGASESEVSDRAALLAAWRSALEHRAETLRAVLADPLYGRVALLQAQARRALGLATRDSGELGRALAILERCGALPDVARVRCERGLLGGDRDELARGMQALDALGDVEQLERYEARARA